MLVEKYSLARDMPTRPILLHTQKETKKDLRDWVNQAKPSQAPLSRRSPLIYRPTTDRSGSLGYWSCLSWLTTRWTRDTHSTAMGPPLSWTLGSPPPSSIPDRPFCSFSLSFSLPELVLIQCQSHLHSVIALSPPLLLPQKTRKVSQAPSSTGQIKKHGHLLSFSPPFYP